MQAGDMVIAEHASYPAKTEVRMSLAIIIISVFVLFCMLTMLIGWGVAAYTHWLVVQPRRVKGPHAKSAQILGEW